MSHDRDGKKRAGRKAEKKPHSKAAVELGERIRALRGDKSLQTVEKELDTLGYKLSNQALSNLERGLTNPNDPRTQRTLHVLSTYYNNDFGLEWLKEYVGDVKKGAEILQADEHQIIVFYREMQPDVQAMALELLSRLRSGEILNTGHYGAKKASKKRASKKPPKK